MSDEHPDNNGKVTLAVLGYRVGDIATHLTRIENKLDSAVSAANVLERNYTRLEERVDWVSKRSAVWDGIVAAMALMAGAIGITRS